MPDQYRGVEHLGADNYDLQQDPETGRAFHASDAPAQSRPSLSGAQPAFGRSMGGPPKGIGGTDIGMEQGHAPPAPQAALNTRQMSPDEMMAFADKLTQEFLTKTKAAEAPHQSSVEPALQRNPYGGTLTPNAPDWLVQYMEGVQPPEGPNMGMTQMGGPGVDKVKGKQYLSQQAMLKHMKAQQ